MKRQILISSIILLLFTAGFATARTIYVPGAYPYIDIQRAINMANPGDVIIIAPGTYIGTGYNISKGITITGTDPNNPYVVAATVIDFDGQDDLAFSLSGAPTVLRGITIANSWRWWVPVSDGVNPGDDGFDSHDWYGGTGINIYGNHIVSNCIIRNCRFEGGPGGNGAAGDANEYPQDPIAIPINYGGNGGRGGHRYGTGIYIASGSPQILNTVVEDCIAIGGPGGAGGEGLDADTGEPGDPNIPGGPGGNGGNGGNAMGAGVYCASGSPTFKNCIIRNCEVRAGDANDGANGGDGIIEDVNLLFPGGPGGHGGVPGLARGAGVYCDSGVNATFTDCQFIGNRAYGGNGGDGGDSGDVHLAMPQLDGGIGGLVEESYSQPGTPQGGNPPSDYSALGAGVYIEHGTTATFTGCTFGDNVTRGSVSGLGGWPSNGNRMHPRKNFPIPSYGAGVYCDDFTTTIFTDCNVQGNWTTQEPNQYQGDLYPYGSGETNPDFQYADVEYIGYGGGMCLIGGALGTNFGYVELNHCNISDNNAPVGGGVCASALTDFHVDECNFVNNLAYLGGGLFSIDNFSSISKSNFIGNRAYDPLEAIFGAGGGLFCFSTDVNISDCNISGNTTNGFGAGMYMAGEVAIPPLTAEPVLKNCLLSDNKAGLDGGGIYCDWYTEPNIINCTITGNEAKGDPPFGVGYGGGLYCSYGSDVNIINSIVWGNAGPNTIGPELAVETWFGFEPTILTVSYCDVEGGQEELWVDDYSTLNWGAGNIDDDPCFVTGPLGNYYLSQTDTNDPNQTADSPCVDAGNDLAINVGLSHSYTTRTDAVSDTGIVDMGYHYPLSIELCSLCDLFRDGIVNLADYAIFSLYWLNSGCSEADGWCGGADLTFDTHVNFNDLSSFYECWLAEDTNAPIPNPSEWEIRPYSTTTIPPYTISMTAKAAFDNWGGVVEYYFECVTGNDSNSGWDPNRTHVSTNLDLNSVYGYGVKARDERGNETLWSVVGYVIAGEEPPPPEDHNSPTPNPMTWASVPTVIDSTSITMTATTATDSTLPVEYYFECTSDGDANSDWQTNPTYVATGLTPSTQYTFMVKARDGAIPHNETGWSDPCSATTPATPPPPPPPDTTKPTPNPSRWASPPSYYSGYCAECDCTCYRHTMTAEPATDDSGQPVQYYFEVRSGCEGTHDSGWQSSNIYDYPVSVSSFQYGQYRVKTKDVAGNETTPSGWLSLP